MKKMGILICIAGFFWSCSTVNRHYSLGTTAAMNKDWEKAIQLYEKAVLEDPDNSIYKLALVRAKLYAVTVHLVKARELAAQGKKEEAVLEYQKALSYDPRNRMIARELENLEKPAVPEEKLQPVSLEPPVKIKAADEKVSLKLFVDTSLRTVFLALGKSKGVNFLFDESFRDKPISVNFTDMTLMEAVQALCLASNNFYRVIDEKTVVIAPDTPNAREKYNLIAVKTFYLSNVQAKDIQGPLMQMIRTKYSMPRVIIDEKLNSITIRDTPEVLALTERILQAFDKPPGEVVIDLEIMEISRIKLQDVGLSLDNPVIGLAYTGTVESESTGWLNLGDLNFSKGSNYLVSLPTPLLDFLESDSDTKIIAQPRLRGLQGEEIKTLVGDKIPLPKATFTPIAAGGISQQPVVNYDYEDVGIDIKITPQVHREDEITLELEIKIKTPRGTGYADLPIISTREVKNKIRLKDGETNLLAGLLKDEERTTLSGIAGLKSIPLLGPLFSNTYREIQQTDVVLTITPHIIRRVPISAEDLRPYWLDLEGGALTAGPVREPPDEGMLDIRRRREMRAQQQDREMPESAVNELSLSPRNFEIPAGREFRMSLNMRTQSKLGNMSLTISYNPNLIEIKDVTPGTLLQKLGANPPFLKNIDNSSGICTVGFSSPDTTIGLEGIGTLAIFQMLTKAQGEGTVALTAITGYDNRGRIVEFQKREAQIRVR
ncbi:MAG: hypothetical protein JXB26_12555 [Candidatus Aminicenantes bacterium]|nr:hypothetical protein [Candidatus Aminicenantes bacterium]